MRLQHSTNLGLQKELLLATRKLLWAKPVLKASDLINPQVRGGSRRG